MFVSIHEILNERAKTDRTAAQALSKIHEMEAANREECSSD